MMHRRGSMLVAVLIVTVLGALTGTTMLYLARAERAGLAVSVDGVQSRALAWSAIQVVAAELERHRDDLLSGRELDLASSWTLWDDGSSRGVARLLPRRGEPITAEDGKLDLNHADLEMLGALEAVGPDLAQEIVTRRDQTPFTSVEELLSLPSVTPGMLYGNDDDGAIDGLAGVDVPPTLIDLLTVYSFEPNVQAGLGDEGAAHRGDRRINLNQPWSDDLHRPLARRYNEDVADAVKNLMSSGVTFASDAAIVSTLTRFQVEPEEWREALDVLTTEPEPYRHGRIDLNTAPAEVLACLPHISMTEADAIVAARRLLSDDDRMTPVWIVTEGIVTAEQFGDLIDHITFRSLQWRFRVEAGIERQDAMEIGGARSGDLDQLELEDAVVFDVVVDLASPRPRIAYLREVTMLPLAGEIMASTDSESDGGAWDGEDPFADDIVIASTEADDLSDFMTLSDWERETWSREDEDLRTDWSREDWSRDEWSREDWSREDWSLESERTAGRAPRRPVIEDSNTDSRIGRWTTGRRAAETGEKGNQP
ncbi:MAG: helix-hairpin-helix domain-containing protein [Phycisphaerales bacterium]|nr:helix-hairpin-helix domain-containing protein [Phycisphaerales bacterium]